MAVDFQDMTIDEPRLKISGNRNNRRRSGNLANKDGIGEDEKSSGRALVTK